MEKTIHNTLEARGYGALIQSEEYALEASADDLQERLVDQGQRVGALCLWQQLQLEQKIRMDLEECQRGIEQKVVY